MPSRRTPMMTFAAARGLTVGIGEILRRAARSSGKCENVAAGAGSTSASCRPSVLARSLTSRVRRWAWPRCWAIIGLRPGRISTCPATPSSRTNALSDRQNPGRGLFHMRGEDGVGSGGRRSGGWCSISRFVDQHRLLAGQRGMLSARPVEIAAVVDRADAVRGRTCCLRGCRAPRPRSAIPEGLDHGHELLAAGVGHGAVDLARPPKFAAAVASHEVTMFHATRRSIWSIEANWRRG